MKYFLIVLLFFSFSLQATTIHVGKNYPIKSVKQGIAATKDGDTLMVHGGWYKEGNLVINKKIVFIGKNFPILDGEKKHEVLSIKSDSVVVQGFKIIKCAYATITDPCGIKVYNSKYVVIQNNILDDNFFGIYLQNCQKCIIKNNNIKAYRQNKQKQENKIH